MILDIAATGLAATPQTQPNRGGGLGLAGDPAPGLAATLRPSLCLDVLHRDGLDLDGLGGIYLG